MNIISILTSLYGAIAPFLSTPAGQKISADLLAIVQALVLGQFSVTIDGWKVTASNNGAPVHFTVQQIEQAVAEIVTGTPASIQSGSTLITFTKVA